MESPRLEQSSSGSQVRKASGRESSANWTSLWARRMGRQGESAPQPVAARLIPQYERPISVTKETIQFVVNLTKEIPHSCYVHALPVRISSPKLPCLDTHELRGSKRKPPSTPGVGTVNHHWPPG